MEKLKVAKIYYRNELVSVIYFDELRFIDELKIYHFIKDDCIVAIIPLNYFIVIDKTKIA